MTVEEYTQRPGSAADGRRVIDEAQFESFYDAEADRLWGYLLRKAGRNDAEDLLSLVFEQFFVWWPMNPDHPKPVAALYRIANCRLADRLRSAARKLTFELSDLEGVLATGRRLHEDGFEAVEMRLDLARALAELTEQPRQALLLHYVAGLSVAECAEALGVGHENMRKILAKARASLQQSPRMQTYETVAAVREVRR